MARRNSVVDGNNFLSAASGLGLVITDAVWMAIWLRRHGTNTRGVFGIHTAAAKGGWSIEVANLNGNAMARSWNDGGSQQTAQSANTMGTNVWNLIVASFPDNNSRTVWLADGAGVTQGSTINVSTTGAIARVLIGTDTSNLEINAAYAFAAVWRGSPADEDRAALLAGAHYSTIQPANLVAGWDLAGVASPEPGYGSSPALVITGTLTQTDDPPVTVPPTGLSATSTVVAASWVTVSAAAVTATQTATSTVVAASWQVMPAAASAGAISATSVVAAASWLTRSVTATAGAVSATSTVAAASWLTRSVAATAGAISTVAAASWLTRPATATAGAISATSTVAAASWLTRLAMATAGVSAVPAYAQWLVRSAVAAPGAISATSTVAAASWQVRPAAAMAGASSAVSTVVAASWQVRPATASAGAVSATSVVAAASWQTRPATTSAGAISATSVVAAASWQVRPAAASAGAVTASSLVAAASWQVRPATATVPSLIESFSVAVVVGWLTVPARAKNRPKDIGTVVISDWLLLTANVTDAALTTATVLDAELDV